jgi:hypothetical protein
MKPEQVIGRRDEFRLELGELRDACPDLALASAALGRTAREIQVNAIVA